MMKKIFFLLLLLFIGMEGLQAWGFFAHRRINRLAVFSLPLEMIGFFKENIQFITENAVNPDRRRYAVEGEAEKHFIDADVFGDSAVFKLPRFWKQAVDIYGEDTLKAYGTGPWNVYSVKINLTEAFARKDTKSILRLAADLGHYIADINVPLHTTENYNGQLTGQNGIHGFWESRIPELLSDDYDLFVGKASYLTNPQITAWEAVIQAHLALDSVLRFEKELTRRFSEDKKFTFIDRGNITTKTYSREFTKAYSDLLNGQVERQMKKSIKMTADFWYTAWVDAGQPDLNMLLKNTIEERTLRDSVLGDTQQHIRDHEGQY